MREFSIWQNHERRAVVLSAIFTYVTILSRETTSPLMAFIVKKTAETPFIKLLQYISCRLRPLVLERCRNTFRWTRIPGPLYSGINTCAYCQNLKTTFLHICTSGLLHTYCRMRRWPSWATAGCLSSALNLTPVFSCSWSWTSSYNIGLGLGLDASGSLQTMLTSQHWPLSSFMLWLLFLQASLKLNLRRVIPVVYGEYLVCGEYLCVRPELNIRKQNNNTMSAEKKSRD